jgi:hypothetical protein
MDHRGELEEAKSKKYEKGCCWTNIGFHMQMKLWDANEEAPTTNLGILGNHRINFSKKIGFTPIVGLDVVKSKDRFKITTSKWHKIANAVNASGHISISKWCYMQKQMGCILWRFQVHFLLHVFNKKQHIILGFNTARKNKLECPSILQQGHLLDD